jgi:LmbE family N-acetylglucosaminyl deacetylase
MQLNAHFAQTLSPQLPVRLPDLALPAPLTILVLAPHPDDFDAIAVSMRFLHLQGHKIHVAVLTSGASGVEDGWNGARDSHRKATLREAEQRESCAFFGLPEERLSFLRLWEQPEDAASSEHDKECLRRYLLSVNPDCVFLPHGNDANRTHRRCFEAFDALATQENLDLLAFLNQDAKTVSMRSDVIMHFDIAEAVWKAELLRMHRSQHDRNLKARGYGFDERVLRVNRDAARAGAYKEEYAEVFELRAYGNLR